MTGEELLNAMEHIDPKLIEQADQSRRKRKTPYWVAAVAAMLALTIGIGAILGNNEPPVIDTTPEYPTFTTVELFDHTVASKKLTGTQRVDYIHYNKKFYSSFHALTSIYFQCEIVVEARVKEVLPDLYSVSLDGIRYHVLLMETLDVLNCENVPNQFFLRIPEEFSTEISKYDSIILTMEQSGLENFVMVNENTSTPEAFSLMFELPYDHERYSVLSFSNGVWDPSIADLDKWSIPYKEGIVAEGSTVEECKNNLRKYIKDPPEYQGKTFNHKVYTQADYSQDAFFESVEPFTKGVFYQTYYQNSNRVIYTRLINGFKTNENITVELYGIKYSSTSFSWQDIFDAPDIGAKIAELEANISTLSSPHADFYPEVDATLTSCNVEGQYYKHNGQVYGIVKLTWNYHIIKDSYAKYCYSDVLYYLLSQDGSCRTIAAEELAELLDDESFLVPSYAIPSLYRG